MKTRAVGMWTCLALLVFGIALAACAPTTLPTLPPATSVPTAAAAGALEGTEWVLCSLRGEPLLKDTHISLGFEGGQASGFAGCNGYGGPYAAEEGILSFPEIAVQLQLCPEPEGVMEQEEVYLQALMAAVNYQLIDGHLEILDESGETILEYSQQKGADLEPAGLIGTAWQLVSMDGQEPAEGSTITLVFHDEHRVSGHAGCRDYVAVYDAASDDLGFSYMAMLGAVCPDKPLLVQEGAYTTTLEWTVHYRLAEARLELLTVRGETLAFEPLPTATQASVEGPTWSLLAFLEERQSEGVSTPLPTDVLTGTEITAAFESGTLSGSAGCNTYGTTYTLDGLSIGLEAIAVTEMACLEPEGVMEQEQHYLEILRDVTDVHVYGSRLWVETGNRRALVFSRRD
jgi:heat shock protein HslJ